MTVLGLLLILVWWYSLISLGWELYNDTYQGNGLRGMIVVFGLFWIVLVGIVEGWFEFLMYRIF